MREAAHFDFDDKWFGQQAVYRVSMGNFVGEVSCIFGRFAFYIFLTFTSYDTCTLLFLSAALLLGNVLDNGWVPMQPVQWEERHHRHRSQPPPPSLMLT